VQELNGINMGHILHSAYTCVNIMNHITDKMREHLAKEITIPKSKISMKIDISTTYPM
jgi:hypothetical protein